MNSETNLILPFTFDNMPVRGKLVRLHDLDVYVPSLEGTSPAIKEALVDMLMMACLLMDDFKTAKSVTLQIQNTHNQSLMIVQCEGANIKAYTNRKQVELSDILDIHAVFSMTVIEQSGQPYQSIIPIEVGASLMTLFEHYFSQSVQAATLLKSAHGLYNGKQAAGVLFVQALPNNMPEGDDWRRIKLLLNTLKTEELVPGDLAATDVLFRLFHEDATRLFTPTPLTFHAASARSKMLEALKSLGEDACRDLLLSGPIEMIDDYTGRSERFMEEDIDALFEADEESV